MLKSLRINNIAVVEHLQVEPGAGLNVITGETGTGKSILVDAVGLLVGSRASPSLIRTGESKALVEGIFELPVLRAVRIRRFIAELDIEPEEGDELIIRREISSTGRNRTFINDRIITAGTLRRLQPLLVEIYGQGDHRSALTSRSYLDVLDSFGGFHKPRKRVSEAFDRWRAAEDAVQEFRLKSEGVNRSSDLLRYQLVELETLQPRLGEDEELLTEKRALANAEKLVQLGSSAFNSLYEADNSALALLSNVRRQLEELGGIDHRVASLQDTLCSSIAVLTDLAETLREYCANLEFSSTRLNEIQNRLAELDRAKRKYGMEIPALLKAKEDAATKLSQIEESAEAEKQLLTMVEVAKTEYARASLELQKLRKKAAPILQEAVLDRLKDVALEKARFEVLVGTASDHVSEANPSGSGEQDSRELAPSPHFTRQGTEHVDFLFSANPGEDLHTLAESASGGELSRLMLTLRTFVSGGKSSLSDTIVFDEVDVGIGGRVAEVVGSHLRTLAAERQVICVTHQPQIARFADHHFLITKVAKGDRTISVVQGLGREERITELARMIGGATESKSARETARWLLKRV